MLSVSVGQKHVSCYVPFIFFFNNNGRGLYIHEGKNKINKDDRVTLNQEIRSSYNPVAYTGFEVDSTIIGARII